MNGTLYLCDGKACPLQFRTCEDCGEDYFCHHTVFEDHAKNGPCEDPENHPDRFERIEDSNGDVTYWERGDFS